MSRLLGSVQVECDTCLRLEPHTFMAEELYGWSIRQLLEMEGWLCRDGQDVCPQCVEERRLQLAQKIQRAH